MKLTHDTLRPLYLQDLTLPDTFHGRTTPKVKRPRQWEQIKTLYRGEPTILDTTRICDNIWCISDTHFGHKNIIEYTDRPYPTVQLMNECLIGNYNKKVKPDDIVIFVGDIGFGSKTATNNILDALNGYKIQIIGNHDMDRDGKVIDYNVDEQHLCYVVDVEDHDIEFQLLFTHYPMDNVPTNCQNVHGHIHQNTANTWNTNVCVEHTNYTPRSLQSVIEQTRVRMLALQG